MTSLDSLVSSRFYCDDSGSSRKMRATGGQRFVSLSSGEDSRGLWARMTSVPVRYVPAGRTFLPAWWWVQWKSKIWSTHNLGWWLCTSLYTNEACKGMARSSDRASNKRLNIQRRLAWSLSKNDTHNRREANLFWHFHPWTYRILSVSQTNEKKMRPFSSFSWPFCKHLRFCDLWEGDRFPNRISIHSQSQLINCSPLL